MRTRKRLALLLAVLLAAIAAWSILFGGAGLFGTAGDKDHPAFQESSDGDHDGIPDAEDQCPAEGDAGAGIDAQGCPAAALVPTGVGAPTPTPPPSPQITQQRATTVIEQPEATEAAPGPAMSQSSGGGVSQDEGAAVALVYIGDGEVRVYAPRTMTLGEVSEIRVEIRFTAPAPDVTLVWNPPPSPTPVVAVGTPVPTFTPLPVIGGGYVPFYQNMGMRLRGLDLDHFKVERSHTSDVLEMSPYAVNWWKWSIKPTGDEALGTNALEVAIFLPGAGADPFANGSLINTIPFTIEVLPAAGGTPLEQAAETSQGFPVLLGIAGGAAGLALVLSGFYTYRRRRAPAVARATSGSPSLFISYSRRDRKFVDRLVNDLEGAGFNVWRDTSDIPAGTSWDNTIKTALSRCTHLLLAATPHSVASPNVEDEISYAVDKGKTVIPLMVEDCELPLRIYRTQWVDFRGDYDEGLARLIAQLRGQESAAPANSDGPSG